MIKPIDGNALFDNIRKLKKFYIVEPGTRNYIEYGHHADDILAAVHQAPILDYAPVRHGEWTLVEKFFPFGEEGEVDSDWYLVCSECGREVPVYEYWPPDIDIEKLTEEYPYCHCGAKMDNEKGE